MATMKTKKVCDQCGSAMPDGSHPLSKRCSDSCKRSAKEAWYAKNKDRISAESKRRYRENPEPKKEAVSRYYAENREVAKARVRTRYWSDPEARREESRAYREKNPNCKNEWVERNRDHVREYYRQYYLDNIERKAERDRVRRARNAELIREQKRAWREANRGRVLAYNMRRRAWKLDQFVEDVSKAELLERDGWVCHLCGGDIDRSLSWPDPGYATVDHVVPLSLGGEHSMANCKAAHLSCNSAKGNRVNDSIESA